MEKSAFMGGFTGLIAIFRCISIKGCPSAFAKKKGNRYFQANKCQRRFGRLTSSQHLNKTVHPPIGPSVTLPLIKSKLKEVEQNL